MGWFPRFGMTRDNTSVDHLPEALDGGIAGMVGRGQPLRGDFSGSLTARQPGSSVARVKCGRSLVIAVLLLTASICAAQDQVVAVAGPVSPLAESQLPSSGFDRQTASLTPGAARSLIRTLGGSSSGGAYIIHVVVWADVLRKVKAQ